MELIPILSLIILVATISTFVLAVGAYILYKVRERKGKIAQSSQPAAIAGEMIVPTPLMADQEATRASMAETAAGFRTGFRTDTGVQQYQQPPIFKTQTNNLDNPTLRPTYIQPSTFTTFSEPHKTVIPTGSHGSTDAERFDDKKKFMRYTSDGYVPPTREEDKKEDKLRWR